MYDNMTQYDIFQYLQREAVSKQHLVSAKLVCWCNFQDWFSALGELRIGGQDTQKALNQQKASIDRFHLFDEVALLREGSLQKKTFTSSLKRTTYSAWAGLVYS